MEIVSVLCIILFIITFMCLSISLSKFISYTETLGHETISYRLEDPNDPDGSYYVTLDEIRLDIKCTDCTDIRCESCTNIQELREILIKTERL